MKYSNCPAKPPGGEQLLPFVQQFPITPDIMRRILYFVQDSTTNSGESKIPVAAEAGISKKYPDIIKLKLYNGEEEQR
ncbi:hypothetical protein P40081_02115 [Paenibacillus sp. FSL P4-0081]|uniref:hypothetical protein n=1 Tax=Paenibacillus sp. FSL P4-0081 TaxID=1536769 RepID=UPI0004F71610|nr:hypothetical protein [Paenibacillus sp. FSL P4-0081]AIQ27122.1 hypothetical protein P40081_02115 [Paenibacillus sp. FSL P4-0081]